MKYMGQVFYQRDGGTDVLVGYEGQSSSFVI